MVLRASLTLRIRALGMRYSAHGDKANAAAAESDGGVHGETENYKYFSISSHKSVLHFLKVVEPCKIKNSR